MSDLDGRLQKISRIIRAEMAKPGATRAGVAFTAARKYNGLRGAEGYAPAELFRGRRLFTHKPFKVDVGSLRDSIRRSRKAIRDCRDRMRGAENYRKRIFIPHVPHVTKYDDAEATPLKLGDLILLYGKIDKNDLTNVFVISEHPVVSGGIDFDAQIIFARKIGVERRSNNLHCFSFGAVRHVMDGNAESSRDYIRSYQGGDVVRRLQSRWNIFSELNPFELKPGFYDPLSTDGNGVPADDVWEEVDELIQTNRGVEIARKTNSEKLDNVPTGERSKVLNELFLSNDQVPVQLLEDVAQKPLKEVRCLIDPGEYVSSPRRSSRNRKEPERLVYYAKG